MIKLGGLEPKGSLALSSTAQKLTWSGAFMAKAFPNAVLFSGVHVESRVGQPRARGGSQLGDGRASRSTPSPPPQVLAYEAGMHRASRTSAESPRRT